MSGAEDIMLLLNTSNSGIFMGRHHHVIHLLGISEGEVSCMAGRAGICAVCDQSWVVSTTCL